MSTDDSAPSFLSRRGLVGGALVGAGALAAAAPAAAQGGRPAPAQPLQDPVGKHPKPPFEPRFQQWPGLASQMSPRPDHGEQSYRGSGRLAGRKALVTGGDSGMGRAAAIAFAREGADVVINHLPAEEADAREVLALIRQAGRKGVSIPGDLKDEAFCTRLVDDAARQLGGLDILVSNAALQQTKPTIDEISTEQFDATFKTNVYAMFWLTKAALKHMKPGSAIIVTSSEQAENPSKDLVDYAMTKACGRNFVMSMAGQLGPKGIRINAVAPGPIWTPLQISGGATAEKLKVFGGTTALGRPGQPAELASIYVQLAMSDASFTTGSVYGADGGRSASG